MSKLRSLALATTLALSATLFGCVDAARVVTPSERPEASSSLEVIAPAITVRALTRSQPLAETIEVQATIGSAGATIELPAAGFRMVVPAGTVKRNTIFTVKALAGSLVAYEFYPEGKWQTKIEMHQDLGVTPLSPLPLGVVLRAGYFRNAKDLNAATNEASVSELLPVQYNPFTNRIRWSVDHFSGYMVAMD